jgi:uncharacterized protein
MQRRVTDEGRKLGPSVGVGTKKMMRAGVVRLRTLWIRMMLAGLVVVNSMAVFSPHAAAQDPPSLSLRIGTGTTGGTYFPVGGIIANAISKPAGARPCDRGGSCGVDNLIVTAEATAGSVENVQLLAEGRVQMAFIQADVAYWAYFGYGPFAAKGPTQSFSTIANLYTEALHVVVAAEAPIETVQGLRGRRVALGPEGSGTLAGARLVLQAYGLGEGDLKANYDRPGKAGDLLIDGELDAMFQIGGVPMQAVTDLAADRAVRILTVNGTVGAKLAREQPFFTPTIIRADAYPGQTQDVHTLGVGAQFMVRNDTPDDLVYAITKSLWNPRTQELLAAGHARGAEIQIDTALKGIGVPLHPGARRFYVEAGLLEPAPPSAEPVAPPPDAQPTQSPSAS